MKIRILGKYVAHTNNSRSFVVVLRRDNWDDFGFKTLFSVELQPPRGRKPMDLGSVKILRLGQERGETQLGGNVLSELGNDLCSLGQDIEYYETLKSLPEVVHKEYLHKMRDSATNAQIAERFKNEDGWRTSLLRFGQAEHTLATARYLFDGSAESEGVLEFVHRSQVLDADLTLKFDDSGMLPGRCKVLVGYNGVGKTQILAEIARDTSKVGHSSTADESDAGAVFSSVIAISYSAFDTFALPPRPEVRTGDDLGSKPNTTFFGYTYCGLRRDTEGDGNHELKSLRELQAEVVGALEVVSRRNTDPLVEALGEIGHDPSFGRVGLDLVRLAADQLLKGDVFGRLSAGQKIVVNIVVQLAAHLRTGSLVLIDEPETHLHPSLLASAVRAIQGLLREFDAYAVIATHSPVVLQEVPSKDVLVVERAGTVVQISSPQLETFGAGLGEITHEAFGLDNSVSDYRSVIRRLAAKCTIDELDELFPLGLSSQARALAIRAQASGG